MNDRYTPTFNIHEAVRKTLPYMMEMREYFHAHPELSEKEFDTCKTIFQELSLMGIEDVKIIAGTGVTGLIHGALPDDPAILHEPYFVRYILYVRDNVGGQKHEPLPGQLADQVAEAYPLVGIQPGRGLVQD